MKNLPLAFAAFLVATTTLAAEPEIKGTPSELSAYLTAVPRTVMLTAEGEIKVPSDRAMISLAVVTENRSLQEASRANQEIRARLIKTLAGQGIPAERIQASRFSSTPKYGVFAEKAKSHRVENVVKITALDEKEFQAVAQLVDGNAEVRYERISFDHSDKENLKQRAAAQAIEKVAEKQKLYESKLGVKLMVKSFEEGHGYDGGPIPRRPMYAGAESKSGLMPMSRGVSYSPPAESGDAELPTSFAELVFKAQLTVEFTVTSR
jgi:uncharacterized protein YggE